MVAARETKEDTNMATIGNFTVNGNGLGYAREGVL